MAPFLALSSTLTMALAYAYRIVEDVPSLLSTVDTVHIGSSLPTFSSADTHAEVGFVTASGAMTTMATTDDPVGYQQCLDEDNYCMYCIKFIVKCRRRSLKWECGRD